MLGVVVVVYSMGGKFCCQMTDETFALSEGGSYLLSLEAELADAFRLLTGSPFMLSCQATNNSDGFTVAALLQ